MWKVAMLASLQRHYELKRGKVAHVLFGVTNKLLPTFKK
jgi:hypothetical protein